MQTSYKHHYVPQWYQKKFLGAGQTALQVLDLAPARFPLKNGGYATAKNIVSRGPGAVFYEKNLYTVRIFGEANDDIERMLFGGIDRDGCEAIHAYLAQDWDKVHFSYRHVFEFMDALRLRTPKGLNWLKQLANTDTQLELMYRMQEWRRMHCVMWMESVLEIVSAANSPTKFIFSDHPVTFFNRHVFPVEPSGRPAADPNIEWVGTQTLFPFDQDNLFVLTHLEGAHGVAKAKALTPRTNARFFDNGNVVRYDKCVRGRELTEAQVLEVNYITKSRAHRYIAGQTEDALYPERRLKNRMWPKLARFLLPPRNQHWTAGGEIFMRSADGTFRFQDQFGQRPETQEEFNAKVAQAERMHSRARQLLMEHFAKQKDQE